MNDLMMTAFKLSLSGSIFILVILFCKPFIRNKFSKGWQYYIWLVVIARLLLPFSLEMNILVSTFEKVENMGVAFIPQLEQTIRTEGDYDVSSESYGVMNESDNLNNVSDDTPNLLTNNNNQADTFIENETQMTFIARQFSEGFDVLLSNLWLIWLMVALILLIRKITIYQSFIRYIKAGRIEVSDIMYLEMFGKIVEQEKIKLTVGLYTNSLIYSPLLIGFFKPCIILPATELSDVDFRNTILHELTHYKRLDMFYKWLVQLAICLHWFNPLVYLMGREINRACELSCDEAVIAKLNMQEQKAYGNTLINALAMGNYNQSLASLSLNEGKEFIKERLDSIMNFKRKSVFIRCATLMLTLVFMCGFAVTGTYAIQQKTPDNQSNLGNVNSSKSVEPSQNVQKGGGLLPENLKELNISLDVNNGGVEILAANINEIKASYDNQYYDVQLKEQDGEWVVSVFGKVAMMGNTNYVQLFIPETKRNIDVNVLNGDFSYNLPKNCKDEISVTAKNGGIHFTSTNHYDNSAISLTTQNKDYIIYQKPIYPDYFTKTDNGFEYKTGTQVNKINILLTGYTIVDFSDSNNIPISTNSAEIIKASDIDTFTMELIKTTNCWDTVENFLPYMTSTGVENVVATVRKNLNVSLYPGYEEALTKAAKYFGKGTKTDSDSPLTRGDIDEIAVYLIDGSANWSYVKPLFPYMTKDGVEQVVAIFLQRTGNYKMAKEAEDYIDKSVNNISGKQGGYTGNAGGIDFAKLPNMTTQEVDALAIDYINNTGEFSYVYNLRQYMSTKGIDEAVTLYVNKTGDYGLVGAMLQFMSENARLALAEQYFKNSESNEYDWIYTMNGNSGQYNSQNQTIPTDISHTDADKTAIDTIQRTGNWRYIEPYLQYMSNKGIEDVVKIYNSKHMNTKEHKKASDYIK